MDIIHVLLRLVHIVAAIAWIGVGFTIAVFVEQALHKSTPQDRHRAASAIYTRSRIGILFPIASLLTTAAGLLLYIVSNSAQYFSQTGNIVLGIGAFAGLLAFAHGGAATGQYTTRYTRALSQNVHDGQPIAADKLAELEEISTKHSLHTRISLVLMVIALIGMASARYL